MGDRAVYEADVPIAASGVSPFVSGERSPPGVPISIRRLSPHDAAAYRALMLAAYADHPDAFLSEAEERAALPIDWWERRLTDSPDALSLVLGAFAVAEDDIAPRLVGAVGAGGEGRVKTRHKATVFGLQVDAAVRRQGIARALMEALLDALVDRGEIALAQLTVTDGNEAASALYRRLGFQPYGTEPMAMKFGDRYLAKLHLWCRLDTRRARETPAG